MYLSNYLFMCVSLCGAFFPYLKKRRIIICSRHFSYLTFLVFEQIDK